MKSRYFHLWPHHPCLLIDSQNPRLASLVKHHWVHDGELTKGSETKRRIALQWVQEKHTVFWGAAQPWGP